MRGAEAFDKAVAVVRVVVLGPLEHLNDFIRAHGHVDAVTGSRVDAVFAERSNGLAAQGDPLLQHRLKFVSG
jgi:hypothetical protein